MTLFSQSFEGLISGGVVRREGAAVLDIGWKKAMSGPTGEKREKMRGD